jgi:hypothetical protein
MVSRRRVNCEKLKFASAFVACYRQHELFYEANKWIMHTLSIASEFQQKQSTVVRGQ